MDTFKLNGYFLLEMNIHYDKISFIRTNKSEGTKGVVS